MTATAAPFGVSPVYHPSGDIRMRTSYKIASAYGTGLYTGSPVKLTTDGTLIATATGADSFIGIFMGCQFISNNRPFILPYWPAGQTYDVNTEMTAWIAPNDGLAEFEAQLNGTAASTIIGEAINLATASGGSIYTGISSQSLNATTTGATPGTFIVTGLAPYANNAWGDAFPIVRVKAGTIQGPVA